MGDELTFTVVNGMVDLNQLDAVYQEHSPSPAEDDGSTTAPDTQPEQENITLQPQDQVWSE